jgi:hypothetical protein
MNLQWKPRLPIQRFGEVRSVQLENLTRLPTRFSRPGVVFRRGALPEEIVYDIRFPNFFLPGPYRNQTNDVFSGGIVRIFYSGAMLWANAVRPNFAFPDDKNVLLLSDVSSSFTA